MIDPFLPNADLLTAVMASIGVFLLIVLVAVLVLSHFIAKAAQRKERSYGSFFALSVLLSPLITSLVVAALPFTADDPRHPKNKK
jgi:hypothetical protein